MERCKVTLHSKKASQILLVHGSHPLIILPADKRDPVAVPAFIVVGKCQATLASSKKKREHQW